MDSKVKNAARYMHNFGIQKKLTLKSRLSIYFLTFALEPYHYKMLSDSSNNALSNTSTKNPPSDAWSDSSIKHTPLIKKFVAHILYEATLQDLLRVWNYAVFQLLQERNNLVDKRYVSAVSCKRLDQLTITVIQSGRLTGEYIAYNHMDFFRPPQPLLPYITTPNGGVLQLHVSKPKGAHYPEDVSRLFVMR
jgi:hypothetical protein